MNRKNSNSNDDGNDGSNDIKRNGKRRKKHKHDNHKHKLRDQKDTDIPTQTTKTFLSRLNLNHGKNNHKHEEIEFQHQHHKGEDEYELEHPASERKGFFDSFQLKISKFLDSFLPSKQQLSDKRLQNRMKVCVLAVCLMWASSLKVAVYISTQAIEVPSAQILYRSCKSAFQVAVEEQEKYYSCVKVQLDQCKNELHRSVITEVRRVNSSSVMNTGIVNRIKDRHKECASDYSSLRYSLEKWVDSGQLLSFDNSTCSDEEQQIVMNVVGDVNLVRTEAMILNEEYSLNSQNTVKRVATYAKVRAEYDKEYLYNRTVKMRDIVKDYLNELSARIPNPDVNLEPLFDKLIESIDEVVSCISPRNPKLGPCNLVRQGIYDLIVESYEVWMVLLNKYVDNANKMVERFQAYKKNVITAYEISSGFYYGEPFIHFLLCYLFCFVLPKNHN